MAGLRAPPKFIKKLISGLPPLEKLQEAAALALEGHWEFAVDVVRETVPSAMSAADLRNRSGRGGGPRGIYLVGRTDAFDGGEGLVVWTEEELEDDGATVFAAVGGSWRRPTRDGVRPEWWGAAGDGTTDDTLALQQCSDYAIAQASGGLRRAPPIKLSPRDYLITDTWTIGDDAYGIQVLGEQRAVAGSDARSTRIVANIACPRWGGSATMGAAGAGGIATITGMSGMTSADVGGWLLITNATGANNERAVQITGYVSATEVQVYHPNAVAETVAWWFPQKPAITLLGRDCTIKRLCIAQTTVNAKLFCGISDMKPTNDLNTSNVFEDVCVTAEDQGYIIHGFIHGDNRTQSGAAPWDSNGENIRYTHCSTFQMSGWGMWFPNGSGQNKKIRTEYCSWYSQRGWGHVKWRSGGWQSICDDFGWCSEYAIAINTGNMEQVTIVDPVSEACPRFLKFTDANGETNQNSQLGNDATILGGRLSGDRVNADGDYIIFGGPGTLNMIGVMFDNHYSTLRINCSNAENGTTSRAANLNAQGCTFPNTTPFNGLGNYTRTVQRCQGSTAGPTSHVPLPDETAQPIGNAALYYKSGRHGRGRASDLVSTGNLVLNYDGDVTFISGTTTINQIATDGWWKGAQVTLLFGSAGCVVTHNYAATAGYAAMQLDGSANWTSVANGCIRLVYDGTYWVEVPRHT